MTSMLPPTRDLPPGRQAQIRAEVERAVTGRRSVRLVVPILAGVASVAAVTTSVVLLRPASDPTPAVQITTSPAPTPAARENFGLTPEQIAAIEEGCAKSSKTKDKMTLYNYGSDDAGRWALLYTDNAVEWCVLGRGGKEYDAGGDTQPRYVKWLPGNFTRDVGGAAPGGDTERRPELAGAPGYRVLAGRVDSSVARITYRAPDGKTAEAKIANGTFVVRVVYPSTWPAIGNESDVSELRVYDAAGKLIDNGSDSEEKCWTMPGTNEVLPDERSIELVETATKKCQPALPWK